MYQLTLGIILLLITSCSSSNENSIEGTSSKTRTKLQEMEWIIGEWEQVSKDGILFEVWTKANDTMYAGKSYMISNHDTIFSEKISLQLKNNELFYIPTVSNQNNAEPITFKLISTYQNEMIFENKQHDFPQRIIYSQLSTDSLYARIEGDVKGEFKQERFYMNRRKRN